MQTEVPASQPVVETPVMQTEAPAPQPVVETPVMQEEVPVSQAVVEEADDEADFLAEMAMGDADETLEEEPAMQESTETHSSVSELESLLSQLR